MLASASHASCDHMQAVIPMQDCPKAKKASPWMLSPFHVAHFITDVTTHEVNRVEGRLTTHRHPLLLVA